MTKITKNRNYSTFEKIQDGEFFLSNDLLYLKLPKLISEEFFSNAYLIEDDAEEEDTSSYSFFTPDCQVALVEVEIIVKDKKSGYSWKD